MIKQWDKPLEKRIFISLSLILLFFASFAQSSNENYIGFEEHKEYRFEPISADASYQIILDVEDPCFEIFSGNWLLSYTGSYLYNYYFYINGPGTGNGQARWIAEGLPEGNYTIDFYADNGDYASDARYQVISAVGISNLSINMNYVGAGWHTLGMFNINRVCVVNISDFWTGSGTKLSVDALRFTLNSTLSAPPSSVIPPHIGICIDDCGGANPTNSSTPIYKMLHLPFKMTFAVMPYNSYTNQSAEEIYNHGSEVILHQLMGYISNPNPSGAGWIRDNMTLSEVRSTVSTNLDSLPHIIGMNNHTGSLITQQSDKMQVCIEELKSRGLFFYDSRTITTSIAYNKAKENGLLTGERDLFIDGNNKDEAKALIQSLALQAIYAPNVPHLAIGHIRNDTADALTEMLSELQAMGVEVWTISKCIAQVVEIDYLPSGSSFTTTGSWTNDLNDGYSKQLYDGYSVIVTDPASTHNDTAIFTPSLPYAGEYDIYTIWKADASNASQIKAVVTHKNGVTQIDIDQSQPIKDWFYLGRYPCNAGLVSNVTLNDFSCTIPGKIFRADAVKYVYTGPVSSSSISFWSFF